MKKIVKIVFISAVLLSAHGLLFSQAVTWQKWYDYNNFEESAEDVIQTFDGGYVILSNIFTSIQRSVVTKTDQFGTVEWQRLYDMNNIGGLSVYSRTIAQACDSGYVISGDNRDSALIFKINKSGDIRWIKKYFGREGGFLDHKITHDGSIIACGYLFNPSIGCVIKTDSIGNKLWDSLYSYTTDIFRILESKDSLYYILGINDSKVNIEWTSKQDSTLQMNRINMSKNRSSNRNGIIMSSLTKTNRYGNVIWKKDLFLPNPIDILEHSSGNIFVGGGLDSMILYKIDTSSSIIFQESYYKGVKGLLSMCFSKEDNILLAGDKNVNNAFLMAVSKIEPNGNLIFNKTITSLQNKSNFAFLPIAVKSTNDYGFIFAGFTDYPPSFHESNFYASKTDSLCNAPTIVSIENNGLSHLGEFNLFQNYPNPFNPATTIKYELSNPGFVELKIYDVKGKEVCKLVEKYQVSGKYYIIFNADQHHLGSGIYFCRLSLGERSTTSKLTLIK